MNPRMELRYERQPRTAPGLLALLALILVALATATAWRAELRDAKLRMLVAARAAAPVAAPDPASTLLSFWEVSVALKRGAGPCPGEAVSRS